MPMVTDLLQCQMTFRLLPDLTLSGDAFIFLLLNSATGATHSFDNSGNSLLSLRRLKSLTDLFHINSQIKKYPSGPDNWQSQDWSCSHHDKAKIICNNSHRERLCIIPKDTRVTGGKFKTRHITHVHRKQCVEISRRAMKFFDECRQVSKGKDLC